MAIAGSVVFATACGSAPVPSPPLSPSAAAPSPAASGPKPAASSTAAPSGTPSADTGAKAIAGLTAWLANPGLRAELGVDGTDAGVVAIHGLIQIDGPDSFLLMGADSGVVFVYQRSAIGAKAERSIGVQFHPAAADLTDTERFGDALRASTDWTDLGTETHGGATLRHLRAGKTGITDAGLLVDSVPPDAPADVRALTRGTLDAWTAPDGTPVDFGYRSGSLDLVFHRHPVEQDLANETRPLARHASTAFGYAFSARSTLSFDTADNGEMAKDGNQTILTYCQKQRSGMTLDGWAGDGVAFYGQRWGTGSGVTKSSVLRKPTDKTGLPIAISTYTDSDDAGGPFAVVNVAFLTKTHACDLQSFVPMPYGDEAHARLDRLLVTLALTG